MYVCVCVRMCTYVCICICICTCIRKRICIHIPVHLPMCVRICVFIRTSIGLMVISWFCKGLFQLQGTVPLLSESNYNSGLPSRNRCGGLMSAKARYAKKSYPSPIQKACELSLLITIRTGSTAPWWKDFSRHPLLAKTGDDLSWALLGCC